MKLFALIFDLSINFPKSGIATIDLNNQQIDGSTDDVLELGNLRQKFEAFGWEVIDVNEGNNLEAILSGLKEAKSKTIKKSTLQMAPTLST